MIGHTLGNWDSAWCFGLGNQSDMAQSHFAYLERTWLCEFG